MDFKIQQITANQTHQIRAQVLRNGIDLPVVFQGDDAPTTFHLGAFDHDLLIGIATFMEVKHPSFSDQQYQLRGMATLPDYRGKGVGGQILKEALVVLTERNIPLLWCNARKIALDFYQKNGFRLYGHFFDVPHIGPHKVMLCNVPPKSSQRN